jgi:hypothetical protein
MPVEKFLFCRNISEIVLLYSRSMKLRSLSPWPKSYDWLHNLTLNLTPEGKFQAIRVLTPGHLEDGKFEVMFEGSQDECVAYMKNVVKRDRESDRSLEEADETNQPPSRGWN